MDRKGFVLKGEHTMWKKSTLEEEIFEAQV